MILKTAITSNSALFERRSEHVTTQASSEEPWALRPSASTLETVRLLAEVTERCTTSLPDTNRAPALEPTAPPTILREPFSPPRTSSSGRDALAVAQMARVRQRAAAQHEESREYFYALGAMPTIDPDYTPAHKPQALHLFGIGAATSRGTRAYQQDVAIADWCNPHAHGVAAVCDGHGLEASGDITPWHWLQHHLIDTLRARLPGPTDAAAWSPHRVCRSLVHAVDGSRRPGHASIMERMTGVNAVENGCTLNAAVRIGSRIYLANVGDSRAVLVGRDGRASQLTVDHKIDEPDEWEMVQARVLAGKATMAETAPGVYRMLRHARDGAVFGIAMSRSIGDDRATVSTPEISMFDIGSDDVALVLGSDGIFDTAHNDQVGLLVSAVMSRSRESVPARCQRAADTLVSWCYDTQMRHEKAASSIDNLTALVLPLHAEKP